MPALVSQPQPTDDLPEGSGGLHGEDNEWGIIRERDEQADTCRLQITRLRRVHLSQRLIPFPIEYRFLETLDVITNATTKIDAIGRLYPTSRTPISLSLPCTVVGKLLPDAAHGEIKWLLDYNDGKITLAIPNNMIGEMVGPASADLSTGQAVRLNCATQVVGLKKGDLRDEFLFILDVYDQRFLNSPRCCIVVKNTVFSDNYFMLPLHF